MADWNDLTRLAAEIGGKLKTRGETLAVSETSSGGLVSAALLSIGGASAYMRGGAVPYSQWSREGLLGIDRADMAEMGIRSSSEPYAALLAKTVRAKVDTDWGLAETGAAGPTGNRYGDAAGHTCVAIAGAVSVARTLETADGDREANMFRFAVEAMTLLNEALDTL
ncbi:MAG: CinA family protein [Alphaproteobacteria bacterium]|nr:CinA family protein [Alphaproteobacteria bacterium]MCB9930969.1 CinA family protein [Alphaproteobacteria bacterium]